MTYAQSLTKAHETFLTDLFPGDGCLLTPEEMNAFSYDASEQRAMPWAVVRPTTREQVVQLLTWADRERMPVYPRSRGTGKVGSAVPSLGGVVVSMLRMNRILDINERDFAADLEPGVVTGDFQKVCAGKKLFYPPDPASVRTSTVGGNIATCAGGLRAVKYGVTRDWVLGLEAVLPGGRVLNLGGHSHKDVVGLDLKRLFVGSSGTLGIMTRVTVKLIPLPETSMSVLVGFRDLDSCMDGAMAVFKAGILPAACEFLDVTALKVARLMGDLPLHPDAQAALLYRLDGTEAGVAAECERLSRALDVDAIRPLSMEHGSGPEEDKLWEVRRNISPGTYKLKPTKLSEDIAVPRSQVPALVRRAQTLGREHGLTVVCYGHLGDGNLHTNIPYDNESPDETRAANTVKDALFRAAMELGGTISGEHGTGITKASFLPEQISPEEMDVIRGVKAVFDPSGIMNPGKGW